MRFLLCRRSSHKFELDGGTVDAETETGETELYTVLDTWLSDVSESKKRFVTLNIVTIK